MRNSALETRNSGQSGVEPPHSKKDPNPTFFWKCVKRKGFKSFVLKVCETKGVTDAFLRKCVNLKELEQKSRELTVESRKRAVEGGGAMAFGEGMGGGFRWFCRWAVFSSGSQW